MGVIVSRALLGALRGIFVGRGSDAARERRWGVSSGQAKSLHSTDPHQDRRTEAFVHSPLLSGPADEAGHRLPDPEKRPVVGEGGPHVAVPGARLNSDEPHPGRQGPRDVGVAKEMWCERAVQPRRLSQAADDAPRLLAAEPPAPDAA